MEPPIVKIDDTGSSSWDDDKIYSILQDMIKFKDKYNHQFCLGYSDTGELVIYPAAKKFNKYLFICAVSTEQFENEEGIEKEMFFTNRAWSNYTIDDAQQAVYETLVDNITYFGRFNYSPSSDLEQLREAYNFTRKLVKKNNTPSVLGYGPDGIVVSPLSRKIGLSDPLSLVITSNDNWRIYDDHYTKYLKPPKQSRYYVDILHKSIADGIKSYDIDSDVTIPQLEEAFEDAVKMSIFDDRPVKISISRTRIFLKLKHEFDDFRDEITDVFGNDYSADGNNDDKTDDSVSVLVHFDDFLYRELISQDKIKAKAREMYEKFHLV